MTQKQTSQQQRQVQQRTWVVRWVVSPSILTFVVVAAGYFTFQYLNGQKVNPTAVAVTPQQEVVSSTTAVPFPTEVLLALPNFGLAAPNASTVTVEAKEVRVVSLFTPGDLVPEKYTDLLTQSQVGLGLAWAGGFGDQSAEKLIYYADILWKASQVDEQGKNVYVATVSLFGERAASERTSTNLPIVRNSLWALYALHQLPLEQVQGMIEVAETQAADHSYELTHPLDPGLEVQNPQGSGVSPVQEVVEAPIPDGRGTVENSRVVLPMTSSQGVNLPGFSLASFVWSVSTLIGSDVAAENLDKTYRVVDYQEFTREDVPDFKAVVYMVSSCPTVLTITDDLSRFGGGAPEGVFARSYGNTFCTEPAGTIGTWYVFYSVVPVWYSPFKIGDSIVMRNLLHDLGVN